MKPLPLEAAPLSGLDEPLLLIGPDLVIRELLSQPAGRLLPATAPVDGIIGQPLETMLRRLLTPAAFTLTLNAVKAGFAAADEGFNCLRAVEGITPAGNRSPGYPRYYDIFLQFSAAPTVMLRLNDVTERLRLAQALEQARAAHELAMSVLRAPPRKLRLFLQGAATSITLINAMLRLPARGQAAFGEKLDKILSEVLMLRIDAGELGLANLAECATSFEQALAALRAKPAPSGDDLLPLAVRLDEMFTQISAASHLDEQRGATQDAATATWSEACEQRLLSLATRVGQEQGCNATVVLLGAEDVPEHYTKSVDSMLSHLVRNAIEHGIEPAERRIAAGKRPAGTITVEFAARDGGGIELTVQDDGAGFDIERIGRIAVETGLLSAEALAQTDPRSLIGLIFRPGFSTAGVAGCNGRGLGMEFLRELVTRLNGTITVSTKARQYTRFRITLPALSYNEIAQAQQRVA